MSMPSMTTTEYKVPPIADGLKNTNEGSLIGFQVKYVKADMDDLSQVQMLREVETRGLTGTDVLILNRDKFTFLERYFIVLQYMERSPS